MARIYDPISGKTLTESQIKNRINSPNLGKAYAEAGITSVSDLKNYSTPADTSSSSTASTTSSSSGSSYVSLADQKKSYGYSMDSADIGKATRVTMDEDAIQPKGTFGDINATGNYVVVDVTRNGKVLRQSIYSPTGRFIKSVNPRASEREIARGAQPDVNQALIELQMERHGTQQQVIQAKQQKFDRDLIRARNISTAEANPSIINRVVSSAAKDLAAAKIGVSYSEFSLLEGNLISEANRKLDYVAIAQSNNPFSTMVTQAATLYTSTDSVRSYYNSTGTEYVTASPGQPQVKTSNGYSLVYFGDPEADPESPMFNREAVVGRIGIVGADGVLHKTVGMLQQEAVDTINKITGQNYNAAQATLALFGVGSVDPAEAKAAFANVPLFRTIGYEDQDYVDPVTGRRPVIDSRLKRQQSIIDSVVNWGGTELYQPEQYGNFTNYLEYYPGGNLYSQTQAALQQYQEEQDAEIATERAERDTGTGPTTPTGPTVTQPTTTPDYDTDTPGVTETPTTDTGTPVAVDPTTPTYPTPGTPYPTQPVTGTFPVETSTGDLGSVPGTVTTAPNVAGYGVDTLTSTMPGVGSNVGVQTVMYGNQFGQTIPVTVSNGKPITYVPPGYSRVSGAAQGGMMRNAYAAGGMSEDAMLEAKYRIASMNGYKGPKTNASLDAFANANEGMKRKFNAIGTVMANKGGYIQRGYAAGGTTALTLTAPGGGSVNVNPTLTPMPNPTLTPMPNPTLTPTMELLNPIIDDGLGNNKPWLNPVTPTDTTASPTYTAEQVQQLLNSKYNQSATQTAGSTTGTTSTGTATNTSPGGGVTSLENFNKMQQNLITQTMQPQQGTVAQIQPTAEDFIPTTAGQAAPIAPMAQVANAGTVQQAGMPVVAPTATMQPTAVSPEVQAATAAMQAAQGQVSPQAQVTAAQQQQTSLSGMEAAQGTAIMMNNPVQRQIQEGELISGAANAEAASQYAEQIQAATATPTKQATVAGQLEGLMQQFEGGETPAWAAGSMRAAMANLSARGLGASSLAGQAVIQAAMEAALPIAQMDAQTQAQFEAQNLSNRQQRAMLAAQQRASFLGQEFDQAFQARVQNSARIGDIANMNFTAEQQVALENARAANTVNLNNLSNRQAMVMAEAAALANLDMANLNNRQQAAVQNAQSFLQMDMANLSNEQQTSLFKAQQNIQALFTDQAAENAAAQFNAQSENQTNQFFANLTAQTSQFNASQQNAMDQFNINSVNAMRQFNSEIQQQRDLFNAQNGLVVAQANAQWRQNIATLNTAAQNESNMDFAKTINALTSTNLDQIWQRERDIMSFAFSAQQSALDRSLNLLLGDKKIAEVEKQLSAQKDAASTELAFRFLFGSDPSGMFGGIFNK